MTPTPNKLFDKINLTPAKPQKKRKKSNIFPEEKDESSYRESRSSRKDFINDEIEIMINSRIRSDSVSQDRGKLGKSRITSKSHSRLFRYCKVFYYVP